MNAARSSPRRHPRPRASAFLLALGALLLATGCGEREAPAVPVARNLLLVTLDTTRADHLSCYGYERPTSPHLDALAAVGHRFSDAQTVMPTTLPSHAAMFTSLRPRELGVRTNESIVSPAAHTLAERLSERGFAAGAFVSATPLHPRFGLAQGFATYDHPADAERPGDETRVRAVEWLRAHATERFFCFVHLFDAHTWYMSPDPWREQFGAPRRVLPPAREFVPDRAAFTPEVRRASIDAYDAEIRFADEQLGALLAELDALGLRETTLVVVLADHGETLDELLEPYGYAFDHGEFLHRRELRVPLVVAPPAGALAAGPQVHDELVSTLDLMPTVLDLLGVPCEEPCSGRSLVPLFSGGALPPRPVVAERRQLAPAEIQRPPSPFLKGVELSATTPSWHFVRCEGRPLELYDVAADPEELVNLSAVQPDAVARMQELIDAWQAARAVALPSGAGREVDPKLLEELRALGYATGDQGE